MHVIFDRQHHGKPGRNDLGVPADVDGDGHAETAEALLTPTYIEAASQILKDHGHSVQVLDHGWYPDRHAEAVAIARGREDAADPDVAYIACHLNGGPGTYGLVLHDHRSDNGKLLAQSVADRLAPALAPYGVSKVRVESASSAPPWSNAYYTIRGIYDGPDWLSGICFEPVFVDAHRALLGANGLALIGQTLAEGIMAWNEAKATGNRADPGPVYQDGVRRTLAFRDARQDPQPGDIVAPGPGQEPRLVLDRDGDQVVWRAWPFGGEPVALPLDLWRAACAEGLVIDGSIRTPAHVGGGA